MVLLPVLCFVKSKIGATMQVVALLLTSLLSLTLVEHASATASSALSVYFYLSKFKFNTICTVIPLNLLTGMYLTQWLYNALYGVVVVAISAYCWSCVYSHYKDVKATPRKDPLARL